MKTHISFLALAGLLLFSPVFAQAQDTNLASLPVITAANASAITEQIQIATNYVSDLAFSPDGNTLAVTNYNSGVSLWNIHQPQTPLVMIGGNFATVAFSPDGRFFAVGGADSGEAGCECILSNVHLYDTSNYEQRALLRGYGGQDEGVTDLAFNPVGTKIITVDTNIMGWDVDEALQAGTLKIREEMINVEPAVLDQHFENISMSPNGKYLAYVSTTYKFDNSVNRFVTVENEITLWDSITQAAERILPVEINESPVIAFSPDGLLLASGGGEVTGYQDNGQPIYGDANPVRLWDVETGQQKVIWSQYNRVSSIAFNPDGTLLATGDYDGYVHVWDVASGAELIVLEAHKGVIVALAFSPDGKLLATGGDQSIRLWGVLPN